MAARSGEAPALIVVTMACGVLTRPRPRSQQSVPLPTPDAAPRRAPHRRRRRSCTRRRPVPRPRLPQPAAAAQRIFPVLVLARQGRGSSQGDRVRRQTARACSTRSAAISRACRRMVGNFVQVGPDGRRVEGTFYIQKPGKVRFAIQSAEPDRDHRRRLVGRGARPLARYAGLLSAVADAAALPARRPHRSSARHRRASAYRPTTPSSPW